MSGFIFPWARDDLSLAEGDRSAAQEFAQRDLLQRLRLEVLLEAAATPDSPLGRALATAITAGTDKTFGAAVEDLIAQRDPLATWIKPAGGVVHGIVARIHEQAAVAAATLDGERASYEGSEPSAKLKRGPIVTTPAVKSGAAKWMPQVSS